MLDVWIMPNKRIVSPSARQPALPAYADTNLSYCRACCFLEGEFPQTCLDWICKICWIAQIFIVHQELSNSRVSKKYHVKATYRQFPPSQQNLYILYMYILSRDDTLLKAKNFYWGSPIRSYLSDRLSRTWMSISSFGMMPYADVCIYRILK
jgi:hypothetical protein